MSATVDREFYLRKESIAAVDPARMEIPFWENDKSYRFLVSMKRYLASPVADLGCGHGPLTILTARLGFTVTGFDCIRENIENGNRLKTAHDSVSFVESFLDRLPAPDHCFGSGVLKEVLEHIVAPEIPAVLAEARRVLGPEGRVVAVEPDNLGQRFYFDGVMEEIGQLFHALSLKARVARQPADISVGPRLPALLREAGFLNTRMVAHVVQSSRLETAKDFCNRLERIAETLAHESGLSAADETVEACKAAIKRCRFAGMPKRLGFSAHTVPVFRCIGRVLPEAEAPGA